MAPPRAQRVTMCDYLSRALNLHLSGSDLKDVLSALSLRYFSALSQLSLSAQSLTEPKMLRLVKNKYKNKYISQ